MVKTREESVWNGGWGAVVCRRRRDEDEDEDEDGRELEKT